MTKGGKMSKDENEIRCELVDVTPDLAQTYLDKNYPKQRKITHSVVEEYAKDMEGGKWCWYAVDPIVFSNTNYMMNGQTRCNAIILSGKTIKCLVVCNVPEDAFDFLDNGSARKAWQFLDMPQSKNVAALSKAILSFHECKNLMTAIRGTGTATRIEVIENARDNEEEYLEIVRMGHRLHDVIGAGSILAYSMGLYTCSKVYGITITKRSVESAASNMDELSIAYVQNIMREFMKEQKPSPQWILGMTLLYVSAFSQNRKIRSWNKREQCVDKHSKALAEALGIA